MHAVLLPSRKLLVARVGTVVHVVVNGIEPRLVRAGVASNRASSGSARLRGSVVNLVSRPDAAALKRVSKAEPMSDFMSRSLAQAVEARVTRERVGADRAAVSCPDCAARLNIGLGEVAVAQVLSEAFQEVKVQVGVGAAVQDLLHVSLVAVDGPGSIDNSLGVLEGEADAARGVVVVENLYLACNSCVL